MCMRTQVASKCWCASHQSANCKVELHQLGQLYQYLPGVRRLMQLAMRCQGSSTACTELSHAAHPVGCLSWDYPYPFILTSYSLTLFMTEVDIAATDQGLQFDLVAGVCCMMLQNAGW